MAQRFSILPLADAVQMDLLGSARLSQHFVRSAHVLTAELVLAVVELLLQPVEGRAARASESVSAIAVSALCMRLTYHRGRPGTWPRPPMICENAPFASFRTRSSSSSIARRA